MCTQQWAAIPVFPSCPECGGDLQVRPEDDLRHVYCLRGTCPFNGDSAGDVVIQHLQPDPGWPRPEMEGRKVPWITPIIGDRVAWAALNGARVREALRHWLCQVCGEPLDRQSQAWVAVFEGVVAEGGAMHKRCFAFSAAACPALRKERARTVVVEVRRGDQHNNWEAVIRRLIAHCMSHGELPDFVPL